MRHQRTEAIILQSYPVRERDKLVVFLSPELGKLRGWAYGARSIRSRYGAALEPLAKVAIGFHVKESEEAVRIDSVDLIRSLFPAQERLNASMAATYIVETTDVFGQANEPSQLLYRLVDRCSDGLLDLDDPPAVIAYFELWVLKVAGVFPSLKECAHCGEILTAPLRFDESVPGFTCASCSSRGAEIVSNDSRGALMAVMRLPLEQFVASKPNREELNFLRSIARRVRRHFLGHELKSYELLQQLL